MPTRKNQRHKREKRQEDAKKRQESRSKLSPKQQLSRLDELLGEGIGAVKERTRLQEYLVLLGILLQET